jgi:transcriptional regulator with PAS, ATPase and Fis domain
MLLANKELQEMSRSRIDPAFEKYNSGVNLETLEANLILQALDRTQGNRSKSAKLLGISRDTLLYRMQKHGFFTSL